MASQQRLDQIRALADEWETLVGFSVPISDWMVEEMANNLAIGTRNDLYSIGQYMWHHSAPGSGSGNIPGATPISAEDAAKYPWAFYGLTADQYGSQATTFGSEYKKLTGKDIPPEELIKAFQSTKDATGGLLSGTEYLQKLQQDADIQKNYGWVRYGMNFEQFQQQKQTMRSQFGRDLSDEEGVTQLQYLHAAQGGDRAVTARQQGGEKQQKEPSVSGSEIR